MQAYTQSTGLSLLRSYWMDFFLRERQNEPLRKRREKIDEHEHTGHIINLNFPT